MRFNVILRIINSRETVKIEKFRSFCIETYVIQLETFPWNNVTPTVHRYLAHSADAIFRNSSTGLAQLSEAPLESMHKNMRFFRKNLARKVNLDMNLTDAYSRLWLNSAPQIRKMKPKKRLRSAKILPLYLDDRLLQTLIVPKTV